MFVTYIQTLWLPESLDLLDRETKNICVFDFKVHIDLGKVSKFNFHFSQEFYLTLIPNTVWVNLNALQVDRSTLTSMVSTSLTYLIILVQFKQNSG